MLDNDEVVTEHGKSIARHKVSADCTRLHITVPSSQISSGFKHMKAILLSVSHISILVTFPSKAAFMAGQGSQPKIGFEVLKIDEVTCDSVGLRWAATVNPQAAKVKVINSFVASNKNGTEQGWQIKTMYSEFNSCQWMIAISGRCGF